MPNQPQPGQTIWLLRERAPVHAGSAVARRLDRRANVCKMEVAAASPAKALARDRVKGLWIAIPTPFTADGRQVDEDVLAASVEHYAAGVRVHGIFYGGVMGEFWALLLDERKRAHETVVRAVAGRVPVMAHVGHHVFAETVELRARDRAGCRLRHRDQSVLPAD
jgi:Dihydrodipicolinate synthetase family